MNDLMDRLLIGWNELLDVLPGLLAAAVVMLAGYFVARQLQRWTDRTLERMHFKRLADAGGFTEAAGRMHMDPVRAVGKLVFWLTMLVVVLLASSALGLENVREMFSRMLGFIPTLISATVIIILGMIIGEFVRALIVASAGGVEGVITVAKLTKGAMVTIAVFMALQQVGVSEEIVTSAFTLVLGSIALAAGLAFGLGNRQLAGEVTRRWYEEGRRRNRRSTDPPEPAVAPPPVDPPAETNVTGTVRDQP
jgi:Conserved TM helix